MREEREEQLLRISHVKFSIDGDIWRAAGLGWRGGSRLPVDVRGNGGPRQAPCALANTKGRVRGASEYQRVEVHVGGPQIRVEVLLVGLRTRA